MASGFYRTLLGSAQAFLKRNNCRREKENPSESLRCCAFLSEDMAVFFRATYEEECTFEKDRVTLLKNEKSFGESPLCLSEICTAFRLYAALLAVKEN